MHTCAPTIQWWIVCLITSRSVLESNLSFLWICLGERSVIKFTRRWYTNAETVLKLIYYRVYCVCICFYAYRPRLNDTKSHWYYTKSDLLTVPNDTFTLRPKKETARTPPLPPPGINWWWKPTENLKCVQTTLSECVFIQIHVKYDAM